MVVDARFDTSKWAEAGPSRSGSTSSASPVEEVDAQLDDEGGMSQQEEPDHEEAASESEEKQPLKKKRVLEVSDLDAFTAKQAKRGIVYISYIPRGMTVAKVRHLLGQFGEVERIFLQDGDEKRSGVKHSSRGGVHYTEGWVEFSSKRVAKTVADMLNAQPIGVAASAGGSRSAGGKGKIGMGARRWRDCIWTMRYLPGFKWGMLSEQLANERAARTARLRTHLSQSRAEQNDYLRKVERARVERAKEEKQQKRREAAGGSSGEGQVAMSSSSKGREKTFKQKSALFKDVREMESKQAASSSGELQGVLSKIF